MCSVAKALYLPSSLIIYQCIQSSSCDFTFLLLLLLLLLLLPCVTHDPSHREGRRPPSWDIFSAVPPTPVGAAECECSAARGDLPTARTHGSGKKEMAMNTIITLWGLAFIDWSLPWSSNFSFVLLAYYDQQPSSRAPQPYLTRNVLSGDGSGANQMKSRGNIKRKRDVA